MKRLLVTGSRTWTDAHLIRRVLREAVISLGEPSHKVTLIHGGAGGADRLAEAAARRLSMRIEVHLPNDERDNEQALRVRNRHMVSLGADLCLAFATSWASDTGMCARMARDMGICVVDWGVDTTWAARPARDSRQQAPRSAG